MSTRYPTGLPATASLQLQRCGDCGHVNYPPRELCGNCLADALGWQPVAAGGTVLSLTDLHYSLEPGYAEHLPWTVASVKLDCGPVVFAHLQPMLAIGARVTLRPVTDRAGNILLAAVAEDGTAAACERWLRDVEFEEITP